MSLNSPQQVTSDADDPWRKLRALTSARIGLGRTGGSLTTQAQLDFQLAHARARDAVRQALDATRLSRELAEIGLPSLALHSACPDRETYLLRPDLGRRLADESRARIVASQPPDDVAIVVADGLSSTAAHAQAVPLLQALLPSMRQDGIRHSEIVIVEHARVAVADEVGELLGARAALILLGERPGLSSHDSLGAYLVYEPKPGRTDAERNCVSNIRPRGLSHQAAAATIHYLLVECLRRKLSGVALRDERPLGNAPSLEGATVPNLPHGPTSRAAADDGLG